MDSIVEAKIKAAAACGIVVVVTEAASEDEFARASARFVSDTTNTPATCLRSDLAEAVDGAIDALTKKDSRTTVQ